MLMLAEDEIRDWRYPGNGGVVCHCERVTRREIEAALTGPIAAGSLAGLKRRTRVTMGRCQGFYCTQELAAITAGRLDMPMTGGDT
jgi:glycerol-3-phosphate dehydrogenase